MRKLPFFGVERSRGGNYRRRFQASHAISLRWYNSVFRIRTLWMGL